MFQIPQPLYGCIARRVTAQVKASDPLDGCNSSISDHTPYIHNRVAVRLVLSDKSFFFLGMSPGKKSPRLIGIFCARLHLSRNIRGDQLPGVKGIRQRHILMKDLLRPQHIHPRSAFIAADRLRVIAPRLRVRVFIFTFGAHRKCAHRRPHSVIGHAVEDREPGPAVRTVYKGVQIPAVPGSK